MHEMAALRSVTSCEIAFWRADVSVAIAAVYAVVIVPDRAVRALAFVVLLAVIRLSTWPLVVADAAAEPAARLRISQAAAPTP